MKLTKTAIVLDTETSKWGKVNDIAWVVSTKDGMIISKRYLIKEINALEPTFYADKIAYYDNLIANGDVPVVPMEIAIMDLLADKEKYGATLYAYNSAFDYGKINKTLEFVGSDLRVDEIIDIWALAYNTIITQKGYSKMVHENGWFTENGNPKMSAETVYRYIAKNNEFVESHTALSDSIIETAILYKALSQHKKRNYAKPNWRTFRDYYVSLGYELNA